MGLFRTFGRNFTPQFVWYRSWFEAFLCLLIGECYIVCYATTQCFSQHGWHCG